MTDHTPARELPPDKRKLVAADVALALAQSGCHSLPLMIPVALERLALEGGVIRVVDAEGRLRRDIYDHPITIDGLIEELKADPVMRRGGW